MRSKLQHLVEGVTNETQPCNAFLESNNPEDPTPIFQELATPRVQSPPIGQLKESLQLLHLTSMSPCY